MLFEKLDEKHEEILEAIWTTAEYRQHTVEAIRKNCEVAFEDRDLELLEKLALILRSRDKVIFSFSGQKKAERIVRRHRLAEVLLNSILKLKSAEMEKVACQVEHSLLPEVEEAICILLGHPELCPDGKPIPKGICCHNGTKVVDNVVTGLDCLNPGESGKITYIKPSSYSNLELLISFGLIPGTMLTLQQKEPVFCIKLENTELALDERITRNIFLWKIVEALPEQLANRIYK